MKAVRKTLILTHRYLGIPLSLLFMLWFASGIAMIYARGMPRLTPELRLERLPPLALDRVRLTPADAARKASGGGGRRGGAGRTTLVTVMDRPAYRFGQTTIFADTGERLRAVERGGALVIASRFTNLPEDKLRYVDELTEPDQWTIAEQRQMPVHKVVVDDAAHTELYISDQNGEVTVMTTRGSRALAWVAAIPHWLYFAPLRLQGRVWQQTVIALSAIGSCFAVLGMVVGILQWKPARPHIPYAGLMRWHHIGGLAFGVLTLTWVFSGLLSMEPWQWPTSGPDLNLRGAFGGTTDFSRFPALDAGKWQPLLTDAAVKEIDFAWIQDEPYYMVRGSKPGRLLVAANTMQVGREPSSLEALTAGLKRAIPDVAILDAQVLSTYDSYYYQRDGSAALPVVRVKFDDPDKTWVYIDPLLNQVVGTFRRYDRLDRWIYHGFHSLDFPFWYYSRPFWDAAVITLCLGGLAVSSIGFFLGIRRMGLGIKRLALSPRLPRNSE